MAHRVKRVVHLNRVVVPAPGADAVVAEYGAVVAWEALRARHRDKACAKRRELDAHVRVRQRWHERAQRHGAHARRAAVAAHAQYHTRRAGAIIGFLRGVAHEARDSDRTLRQRGGDFIGLPAAPSLEVRGEASQGVEWRRSERRKLCRDESKVSAIRALIEALLAQN